MSNIVRSLEITAEREAAQASEDWPWYRAAGRVLADREGRRDDRLFFAAEVIRSLVSWHGYDRTTGHVVVEERDFDRQMHVTIGYRIAPAIHERLQQVGKLERERAALMAHVHTLALWAPVLVVLLVLAGVALGLHAHPRCIP